MVGGGRRHGHVLCLLAKVAQREAQKEVEGEVEGEVRLAHMPV